MAAERKLKAEIDRTLKKVQEGQEIFDDIWNQARKEATMACMMKRACGEEVLTTAWPCRSTRRTSKRMTKKTRISGRSLKGS